MKKLLSIMSNLQPTIHYHDSLRFNARHLGSRYSPLLEHNLQYSEMQYFAQNVWRNICFIVISNLISKKLINIQEASG